MLKIATFSKPETVSSNALNFTLEMEILYLKELQDSPFRKGITRDFLNVPLTELEINELEKAFNSGSPFPKALRELLFLAGDYCYVLDYGLNKKQVELQNFVRQRMTKNNRILTRAFYAIDIYNAGDQFLFIYLDEGDDPPVYEGHYYDEPTLWNNWITSVSTSLSSYLALLVVRVKEGQNPF